MMFSFLSSAELTDIGRKRRRNEDSLLRIESHGVFCVSDGMGGADSGDVASNATVQGIATAMQKLSRPEKIASAPVKKHALLRAINDASLWIFKRSEEQGRGQSGATVVVLVMDAIAPDRAVILHAGDSRIYRYRGGHLEQLTTDHSFAEEAGFRDEDKLPKMFRGVVTRAVGVQEKVNVQETTVEVRKDDIYLLCSDGLTRMVPDKKIAQIIRESSGASLDMTARQLVNEANNSGGHDNISVILVKTGELTPVDPSILLSDDTREEHTTETADTALPGKEAVSMHEETRTDPNAKID